MNTTARLIACFILISFMMKPHAELPAEIATIAKLPAPSAHWIWVTDISYPNFVPGTAHLLDANEGKFLGMITMGYGLTALGLPSHLREIYTVETHYDRTYRGNRHDMVGIYATATLDLLAEIEIPPKKLSAVPMLSFVGLTDNDKYFLIYNFTPSQSVSVVDVAERKFVTEIDTAGCGLTLPAGDMRFLMLCSNGALRDISFSESGEVTNNTVHEKIFDRKTEFLTEKAVRINDTWLFVTNTGMVQPVDVGSDTAKIEERWPLFSASEIKDGWKIGGQQHLAIHKGNSQLFAAVHQGGIDSHKDPGSHVFVYDLKSKNKIKSIALERVANAIQVSQDQSPLLITTNAYPAVVDIYDADTGKFVREVGEAAISPMTLQTPMN